MHFYTGYRLWPSVWKSGSLTINTHHVSLTNNKLCTLTDHFIRNTRAPAHWCSHVAAPRVLNSCRQTWRAAVNVHIQDQKGENTRSPTETSSLVTELAQHLTSAVQIHNPGCGAVKLFEHFYHLDVSERGFEYQSVCYQSIWSGFYQFSLP